MEQPHDPVYGWGATILTHTLISTFLQAENRLFQDFIHNGIDVDLNGVEARNGAVAVVEKEG